MRRRLLLLEDSDKVLLLLTCELCLTFAYCLPRGRCRYTLSFGSSATVTVTADTVYGAMAGMETFSQLFVGGALVSTMCAISDYPTYGFPLQSPLT